MTHHHLILGGGVKSPQGPVIQEHETTPQGKNKCMLMLPMENEPRAID